MLYAKVNDRRAQEKLRRAIQAVPRLRQQALKEIAGKVGELIVQEAPRDTNAYANAWAQAFNQAGLGPLPTPPLNSSSSLARYADYLLEGVRYWNVIVENNASRGATGKWPMDAIARLAEARMKLEQFNDSNPGRLVEPAALGIKHSLKSAVINAGGVGESIQVGDRTYYRLTNKEPHARFVEGRTRLVQTIRAPFKALGLSDRVTKGFIKNLAIASGLAVAVPGGLRKPRG